MNYLLVTALRQYAAYYDSKVEFPTHSGNYIMLSEVATALAKRLISIFERDQHGNRPVNGHSEIYKSDPHFKDYVLFHEYFHGDNGAGLGASHQTGWTGLVAKIIQLFGFLDAQSMLQGGKAAFIHRDTRK